MHAGAVVAALIAIAPLVAVAATAVGEGADNLTSETFWRYAGTSAALTLLVGGHAQAYYLGRRRKASLTETVRDWRAYLEEGFLPLPHPSPRNQPWLAANPWFEAELLPDIRAVIRRLGL